MLTSFTDLKELKCPYCGKQLNGEEYKLAIEEFKIKAAEEYEEQREKEESLHREQIKELTNIKNEEVKIIRQELQISFQKQLEEVKKIYTEINTQRQKEFREQSDRQSIRYEETICEKDRQNQELKEEIEQCKVQALNQARSLVENEMLEKATQIQRLKEKVDSLSNELSKTQSELIGEVGETNLLKKLEQAFPQDIFKRPTRGNSGGDIIQNIKTTSGAMLQVPIVYDNKEAVSVSRQDLEKAKRYREIHGTDHVIIVSKNLPKDIGDSLGGEKEGILIVHPQVAVLVAKEIRKGLIEISKRSASTKDQQTKQALLYDYIRSREFWRNLASVSEIETQLSELQKKEIKSHQTLWKNREALYQKLNGAHSNIHSSVDAIIQEEERIQSQTNYQSKNELLVDNGNGNGGISP